VEEIYSSGEDNMPAVLEDAGGCSLDPLRFQLVESGEDFMVSLLLMKAHAQVHQLLKGRDMTPWR
jgi:hypothetical protein